MQTEKQTEKQITEYELLDHGIDGAQYFPGCGTAFTSFDHVATGCGDNFAEALDDCFELMAQGAFGSIDFDALENQIKADVGYTGRDWPTTPSASEEFRKANDMSNDDDDMDGCEMHYYVSIRYNL